jgi:hypothetical protein
MIRLAPILSALALGAVALSACADRRDASSTTSLPSAGNAAPTFNCQDRGTCGGPTAVPGTGATDSPGPRGNGRQ